MSTQSFAGALIGGVAGFMLGGPFGIAATQGIMLGAAGGFVIGTALTPIPGMSQQGPRLSDLKVQTSTYGAAIPRVSGTVGITGNVIWLEGNQLKEVVTRRKVKAGGKGGSKKTTVTTYTYYATLAIGLCEGPIAGVRRIWAGPNLIYDAASDDLETIIASNQNAAGFTIYRGVDDQQPDSRIQADRGVDNTPAYRGLAYIVINDFKLTDYGNAIPAFRVEVVQYSGYDAPELMSSYFLDDVQTAFRDLYQTTGMYADANAGMSLFRASSSSTAQPWKSGTVGFRKDGDQISTPDNHYVFGESDVKSVAITGTNSFTIRNDVGEIISTWNLPGVSFIYSASRLHVRNGEEYICRNESAVTTIYKKITESLDSPVIVSTTTAASPRGQIHDICVSDNRIYSISKSKQLTCYDLSFVEQWNVDMSAADFTADLYSGSVAVIRSMGGDSIILRQRAKFWRIDKSGYIYIGEVPGMSVSGQGSISDKLIGSVWLSYNNASKRMHCINVSVPGNIETTTSESVVNECLLSSLLHPSDIDASLLSGNIGGYRVSGGSIRSALEPLAGAYSFDAVGSGYQLKFLPRGGSSVASIDIAELGADEQLPQAREMDGQLPADLRVRYLDLSRNYDANEQFAERINTDAVNSADVELAVVLGSSQAAQIAEKLLGLAWLERVSFGPFQLPPTYRHLEPVDVITIDAGYAQYELRLTEISYNADGTLTCFGRPNSASIYVSTAASDETPSAQTIKLGGDSLFVPMDIPVIDETIQDSPGFVGAMTGYTNGWSGAVAVRSADGGQSWSEIQAFDGKATIGYAAGTLAVNDCSLIDEASLSVSLISGELESVTDDQMLAGTNWAAYGEDGRWEIVRFRDAVLQGDGSYLLSGIKRGDKGTEWATGLHQDGDLFVALDDGDLAAIGMPVESIGVDAAWRGVTSGSTVDSASDVPFTYRGVNLECLSPVYQEASRNVGGDLALSWTRRSRLSSSWWATGTAAPLGEAVEAYEVDILNGATVVRTISSSTPSITYTAAEQAADFGSPQASISARIYQLSSVVGRGYPLEGNF